MSISERYRNLSKENAGMFLERAAGTLQDDADGIYSDIDDFLDSARSGDRKGAVEFFDSIESGIEECREYLDRIEQLCEIMLKEEK